jgi:sterol desaturase/sphingolipid hydroxylase (fatty acid hydroxylase superfamily)
MALIGIRPEIFVTVSSIHFFIQFYNHNHLIKNSGFLDKFLVTPKHHRIHHGKNEPYLDKNFGGTFLIWDKLFGTFQKEDPENPVEIGIENATDSSNPFYVNTVPFTQMRRDNYNFESPKKEGIHLPNYILISGVICLFLMLLTFVFFQHSITTTHSIILFFTVFLGTIANGFLLDGNKFGSIIWLISNIISPCYMLFNFHDTNDLFKIVLTIFIIHGIFTFYYLLSNSGKFKSENLT